MPGPAFPVIVGLVARAIWPIIARALPKYVTRSLSKSASWVTRQAQIAKQWTKQKARLVPLIGQKLYIRFLNTVSALKGAFRKLQARTKKLAAWLKDIKAMLSQKITSIEVVKRLLKKLEAFKKEHAVVYAALATFIFWVNRMRKVISAINTLTKIQEQLVEVLNTFRDWWRGEDDAKKIENACRLDQKAFQSQMKSIDFSIKSLRKA